MHFDDISGILQTGIAFNFGASAVQLFGDIGSTRFKRRMEAAARCEFLFSKNAEKLGRFTGAIAAARGRLRHAEDALDWYTTRIVVPVLFIAGATCCYYLAYGAWHSLAELTDNCASLLVFICYAPSLFAILINAIVWQQFRTKLYEKLDEASAIIAGNES